MAGYLLRALIRIDIGLVMDNKIVTRQNVIWIYNKKRLEVLQKAHCSSTGHLWEANSFNDYTQVVLLKGRLRMQNKC